MNNSIFTSDAETLVAPQSPKREPETTKAFVRKSPNIVTPAPVKVTPKPPSPPKTVEVVTRPSGKSQP